MAWIVMALPYTATELASSCKLYVGLNQKSIIHTVLLFTLYALTYTQQSSFCMLLCIYRMCILQSYS